MTAGAPPPGGRPDLLTRTTLGLPAGASHGTLAAAVRALQHVPGVLLAEIDAAGTRAVVAHDAAVPGAALIGAAAAAGVAARIIADTRSPAAAVTAPPGERRAALRRAAAIVTWVVAALMIAATLTPLGATPWVLPVLIGTLWLSYLADVFLARRS